ncbi:MULTISPECIES: DsbC family protein [unclassified Undibacterium]|uniref:DsbC family protein n=1 Tax=unclassified Undibacterium TaxID=2630295 RepID=UPI002AC9AC2C|nr:MULTISPECIES: DsbC family protein [unclassified Undibacterium]MEB0140807.1 DsbC family protein [Undibacterium sp. CCC2.1]MEB0173981.1 DsbC family protein [Undibacterium sp. CCC1.1]MEB0177931.1 DsbC family protein [Undibacterium sp. CCC3.4]MEB0217167.1 DsbC family protein [Undibacterium sp. 5I2]WPX45234.1 DsbC family protein [Undibacterium sp. CCC3.4]
MHLKQYIAVLALALSGLVAAETPLEATVKKLVEPRLGEGVKVDSVTKTPYAGLYEVRIGSELLYTDEKAQFLFLGNVVDAKTGTNYTKARTDDLSRIKFSDLPLDLALKTVKGDGKRVIAVFEDPNCGYCKHFRKTLTGVDNITVYTFMYNILSEDSTAKSKNIWCSADRSKAWDEWMLNGKVAPAAAANCMTPNDKVLALGRKLRVNGTPAIFFVDGTRVPGAMDGKALEDKLASLSAAKAK